VPTSENIKKNFKSYFQFDLNEGLPEEIKNGSKYDYILMLDILEHLVDYDKIIEQAKILLSGNGKIIISLPNIANIYVRLNLLFGRFPYSDKGILDRTHLRFFTLGAIKKLVHKHNLDTVKIKVTPIPIIEVLPNFLKNNFGKFMNLMLYIKSVVLKRLFGYQFIVITEFKK